MLPGELAPEFTFQDAAGKWVSLSDFRGKKVFIFSWSTWCRCREQLPELEKFYKQYKSDRFEVFAVASDSQGFKWVKQYLDNAGATFIALVDPNNDLGQKFNFWATENGFLVDEAGIVRMNSINFDIRNSVQRAELVKLMNTDFKAQAQKGQKVTLADRIKAAEAAASANPKDLAKKMELAELYRQNADFAQAESVLREALKTKPLSADAHYRLGVALYQKGEIVAGVKEWEKAYQLQPRNYIYMRNLQAYRNPRKFYSALLGDEK